MIRNLKFLGLALVAAIAMTSVTASVASADVITAEATSTTLTGAQEGTDVLRVHAGEAKCNTVKYSGSLTAVSSPSFTLTPTFTGCIFVGLSSTINMNGCSFKFNINPAAGNTTVTIDLVCAAGHEMTVTAPSSGTPKCIVHIPAQTGLGPASFVNVGSMTTREITGSLSITNLKYSQTSGTAMTGNCATADSTTDGTYTGKALVTGENSAGTAHIGIFLS